MMPVIPASQRPRSVAIQHPYLPTCMGQQTDRIGACSFAPPQCVDM